MDLTMVLIAVLCVGVLGIMIYLAPAVKKWAESKGLPVESILDSAEVVTKIAEQIGKTMFPAQATVIDLVSKSAQLAVNYAEQLYKSNQCTSEERKDKAIEFVKMSLNDAGVPVDQQKEEFIEKVVESAVYALPKTNK
jgi:hypothetical protein